MPYKGKHVLCNSTVDFAKKLKDFLVDECGWIHDPASPTIDLTARTAQDDKHAHILGWFLKSNGEDSNQNIPLHIGTMSIQSPQGWCPDLAYLAAGILATDTSITLKAAIPNLANGEIIQIGDELIQVGVIGTTLTSCVRGMYGTTAAVHDVKDVAVRITNSYPTTTISGLRELVNPLMSSTGTVLWSLGDASCTDDIVMDSSDLNTTYDDNKLNYCSLLKTADGKMRWITGQTVETTGKLRLTSYTPFFTSPGAQHIQILSPAMHPQASRHQTLAGVSNRRCPGLRYNLISSPRDCWFYGSKDGVAIICMMGNNNYIVNYVGLYTPFGSTDMTTATSTGDGNIAAGATQIKVANTALFTKGGRYMLLSCNPGTDWHNNRNQVSNTYQSAPGGGGANSWPQLDADEAIFEPVLVTDVNEVTNVLTLHFGTAYSYMAGAIIGECIRCHVGPQQGASGGEDSAQFGGAGTGNATVWHSARNDRVFISPFMPVHRIKWRCSSGVNDFQPVGSVKPWQADFQYAQWVVSDKQTDFLNCVDLHPEAVTGALFLVPWRMKTYSDTDYRGMGQDHQKRPGYIPHVRSVSNVWNAVNEDTIKVRFQGVYQTFRLFYCTDSGQWVAMGPEIA